MLKTDFGSGPCRKQEVTATLLGSNGDVYIATNHCDTPQSVCPRAGMPTGVGYELCKSVCNQRAHAEVNVIALAGEAAKGSTITLTGHYYACESCKAAAAAAGVEKIVIG